ncbi:MAG: purine-binding chemotaxis protein CheW [SAR324 cluster bacterium]|nr:purine-binding chemotaxis protein CheW [SAR324 cluster bacterium]
MPQIATFYIGKTIFGIDILLTKEIGKIHDITPVPESSEYILGLMNLRGQILTIMDPRFFLSDRQTPALEDRRLIIFKTEAEMESLRIQKFSQLKTQVHDPMAIVIDKMGDVLNINSDEITSPPSNLSGIKREFVYGVIQREKQLVILLDINQLVKMCFVVKANSNK